MDCDIIRIDYVKLTDSAKEPVRNRQGGRPDSGFDLFSDEEVSLEPGKFKLVSTGIALQFPDNAPGVEGQVRSRSGLAAKQGVFVLNSPGTVDWSYTGEIKIVLANFGDSVAIFPKGSRLAQLVICKNPSEPVFVLREKLGTTTRGANGCGSTGI